MVLLPATDLGHGPDLVLLHGVGVGPESFTELAQLLAVDHRVLVLERPGADGRAIQLDEQAAAVASTVEALGCRATRVVGVSGGATLALVIGLRHPEVVGSLVVHEPLVGTHAPVLHERFAAAAEHASRGDAQALEVVRDVLGEATWGRLDPVAQARVAAGAARARAEVSLFASFTPSAAALGTLRARPMLTTIGADSGRERRAAAEVLVALAGASLASIPGAGNAVQLDAPAAFAATIRAWQPAISGCGC